MWTPKAGEPLTNWVDVKKTYWRPEDGVKHVVVKGLGRAHQDIEEDQTAYEAKHNWSGC